MIFVGIDGGGTKTQAIAVDEDGRVLAEGVGGPSNIAENPRGVVEKSLRDALEPLKGFVKGDAVVIAGMPAVGEIRGVEKAYEKMIEDILGVEPKAVFNDVVVGWAAGTLGEDGIHVVAGTGSIAYGKRGEREARCGGWGSIIGDEGSAYYIGRKVLQSVTMMMDGRMEETTLKNVLFESLEFRDQYDLLEWVYSGDRRSKIASIAVIAHRACLEGDEVALKILRDAGRHLARHVLAISKRLSMEDPLVTYSGSVLEKNDFVRETFEEEIKKALPRAEVRKSRLKPVFGAVILGFKMEGLELPFADDQSMFQK